MRRPRLPEELRVRLPEYAEPFLEHAPYKSMSGSRASAKSHSFAQMPILRMGGLLPAYPDRPVRIASARDYQVNIDESVKQVIESYIYQFGMEDEFEIQAYEINHVNGSHMWFPGFDVNPRSFMSVEAVDVLWFEQAELVQEGHMEVIVPSMFRDAENMAEMWFSWNPFRRDTWCWQRFEVNKRPDDLHIHVTFADNPFFPPGMERERQALELEDPERYKHVWLGEPDDGDADKVVLAYSVLKKCVEAYQKGLAPSADDTPLTDSGLDVAEGGRDKCAQVIRQGPVIDFTDEWPGVAGDLSVPVVRAHENTIDARLSLVPDVLRRLESAPPGIPTDQCAVRLRTGGLRRRGQGQEDALRAWPAEREGLQQPGDADGGCAPAAGQPNRSPAQGR